MDYQEARKILLNEVQRLLSTLVISTDRGGITFFQAASRLGHARATVPTQVYTSLTLPDLLVAEVPSFVESVASIEESLFASEVTSLVDASLGTVQSSSNDFFPALSEFQSLLSEKWHGLKTLAFFRTKAQATVASAQSMGATRVSVVPNPGACKDCLAAYVEKGSPKIFNLTDLSSARNTDHTKKDGIHQNWVPTIPPLHKHCSCQLVVVPDGMAWVGNSLEYIPLAKSDKYEYWPGSGQPPAEGGWEMSPSGRSWRREAGGRSGGAKQEDGGRPIPGTRPAEPIPQTREAQAIPKTRSAKVEEVEVKRPKTENLPASDQRYQPEDQVLSPSATSEGQSYPEESPSDPTRDIEVSFASSSSRREVLDHLSSGEISSIKPLGDEAGINPSLRVKIAGNGSGIMKPDIEFKLYMWTTGQNCVPKNSAVKNEVAAYKLSAAMGLGLCPITTIRKHEGKDMSIQHWQANSNGAFVTTMYEKDESGKYKKDANGKPLYATNTRVALKNFIDNAPDKTRAIESLSDIVAFDVILNNNDRHVGNILIGEDNSSFVAIDHGVSFGNSMYGFKNTMVRAMTTSKMDIVPSKGMQDKLKNTSFSDVKIATHGQVEPWQAAQSFLRTKYVDHLLESDGKLDPKHFESLAVNSLGRTMDGEDRTHMLPDYAADDYEAYHAHASANHTYAHDRFEAFAFAWIDHHKSDPSSPFHQDAREIDELGAFMGSGFAEEENSHRENDKHKVYETGRRFILKDQVADVTNQLGIRKKEADAMKSPASKEKSSTKPKSRAINELSDAFGAAEPSKNNKPSTSDIGTADG